MFYDFYFLSCRTKLLRSFQLLCKKGSAAEMAARERDTINRSLCRPNLLLSPIFIAQGTKIILDGGERYGGEFEILLTSKTKTHFMCVNGGKCFSSAKWVPSTE